LWVLLRVSLANLSKIQPGKIKAWKAGEIKPPDTAALKYWLGNCQPDRWREQPEEYLIEDEGLEGRETD
jgi:hypothetical protein